MNHAPCLRPLTLRISRRNDKILAAEHFDAVRQLKFYRSVGGGIEFGACAADAVVREIRKELQAEVREVC